jgi:hypothetical protein
MEAQRPQQGVVRGEREEVLRVLAGVAAGQHLPALGVPGGAHLAALELLVEDGELPRAVEDLRMVVDAEEARHQAARVARELDHGDRVPRRAAHPEGLPADRRHAVREGDAAGDEVEEAVVEHAQAPAHLLEAAAEPGVVSGLAGEHVLEHAGALPPLLRPAQDGRREPGPVAEDAEGVADREQRRILVAGDVVEEAVERRLPGGVLADPLAPLRDAVVLGRVDVPGAAGAEVERVASARRVRDPAVAAHVEGEGAHADAGLEDDRQQLAGGVEHRVDQAVVAEVRPAVVHVEHRDVDEPRIGRGEVLGTLDADVLEGAAGGVDRVVGAAERVVSGELVLTEEVHRW